MEPKLRRNQNGFCEGRSTLPQILALRRIIEEIKIANRKASTDLDYEDDIALLFHQINNAKILLQTLETTAHKVSLTLNSTKTECMLLNQEFTGNEIHTLNGHL